MKGSPTFLCATIPVLNHRPLCSQNILHLIEAKFYIFLETMNNFSDKANALDNYLPSSLETVEKNLRRAMYRCRYHQSLYSYCLQ